MPEGAEEGLGVAVLEPPKPPPVAETPTTTEAPSEHIDKTITEEASDSTVDSKLDHTSRLDSVDPTESTEKPPTDESSSEAIMDELEDALNKASSGEEHQESSPISGNPDTKEVSLKDMTQEQLSEWFDSGNIHNGTHFLSPTDNDRFQELCKTDLKEAIRFLREKWGEYVDRDFIQSFALIHWVANSESGLSNLEKMLGNSRHEVEISTQAYPDEKSLKDNPRWLHAKFGVLVDGRVNLASNADIQTNQWHGLLKDDIVKRRKYTEWANRLITNKTNCVSPYEFVVDDWKVVGIVIDPDTPGIESVIALAKKYGIPVIDTQNSDLFTKQTTVAPTTSTT